MNAAFEERRSVLAKFARENPEQAAEDFIVLEDVLDGLMEHMRHMESLLQLSDTIIGRMEATSEAQAGVH